MDLTVGVLEDKLRKFSKGIPINVSCEVCHHGAMGNETIISVEDKTNQSYGYIELTLNASSKPDVKVTKDEKIFYDAEIKRLTEIIDLRDKKIERYEGYINSSISDANRALQGRY
ncbi:hypothetical protein [Clostridium estertheticum]|uniref:Uncharacterized protein n=1 Tax=Clostridium estertheticum TaxID=238834 RepID=A0AA47EJ72_9CLOT|nr:hypothetical protein [Clostridium estertheticum]MBU3155159.1 hypothetical protein [Clostridium estertheticum]WAG61213.1 hypothetical protein LL038_02890 [Clostridium estertheticum]